jgi:hypothetical protein
MHNPRTSISRFCHKSLPVARIEQLTQIVLLVLMCVLMCWVHVHVRVPVLVQAGCNFRVGLDVFILALPATWK